MLLDGKTVVIYGGGGSIGGAVARECAREGAHVHLAGRTQAALDAVAADIQDQGGAVETAIVDALDERQVDDHAEAIGAIDVSLNVIAQPSVHGTPMIEMAVDEYAREVDEMVRGQFITTRAAGRSMARRGSGTILFFGGDGPPIRDYMIGGTQTAFAAVEAMRRQLAVELGPRGIRTVTLRTGGILESIPAEVRRASPEIERSIVGPTTLGRAATLVEVGRVAAFAASDGAASMTGATVNVSCGALID